jgi:hypothetical protein
MNPPPLRYGATGADLRRKNNSQKITKKTKVGFSAQRAFVTLSAASHPPPLHHSITLLLDRVGSSMPFWITNSAHKSVNKIRRKLV